MVGLPAGEKSLEDIYNRLDTILACDRQTDICHGIVRAMHTRRVVKSAYGILLLTAHFAPETRGIVTLNFDL